MLIAFEAIAKTQDGSRECRRSGMDVNVVSPIAIPAQGLGIEFGGLPTWDGLLS